MSIHLLLPLTILVVKVLEEISRRVGMPAILGAILAGICLGPLGFNITPDLFFDHSNSFSTFNEFAQIGLCVLLFRIGTEGRFEQLRKIWKQALIVAFTGMALPLGLGCLIMLLFGYQPITSFFVGATLTATSIGVTIPVLKDLAYADSNEGFIITGAAIIDDVLGLILLSIILTIIQPVEHEGSGWIIILYGIVFIALGFTIGPILVDNALKLLRWLNCTHLILIFAFSYLLVIAQIAHEVGLDMIIGAYAAGVAFNSVKEREQIETGLKPVTDLFAPLFFVLIGASIRVPDISLNNPQSVLELYLFITLLLAAIAGKILSAFPLHKESVNRWVVGFGMLPRGEVGLIFAQIGLLAGLITESFFSLLVLLLVITTYMGPLLLKLVINKPKEKESLQDTKR